MGERWQRFAAEAGRFLTVGLVATIVALVLFNLLVHGFNTADVAPLNGQPELAYFLANAVGMAISYRGTKRWAFRDREARHADGGLIAFVAINVATMLLPMACLFVSRNLLHLDDPLSDNISANVIGLVLGMAARFFLFRTFVFHRVPPMPLPMQIPFHLRNDETGATDVSSATDRSTSGRVPPPAP